MAKNPYPDETTAKGRRYNSQQDVDNNVGLTMTPQWYLNHSQYEPKSGNDFHPYFCGEDVFKDIAASIQTARKSIDIISWGFDPAMPLLRTDPVYSEINDTQGNRLRHSGWQQKDSYGQLLLDALERNDKLEIRIIIWYYFGNAFINQTQNMVGVGHSTWLRAIEIAREEGATGFDPVAYDSEHGLDNLPLRQRDPIAQNFSMDWFHKLLWGSFKGDGRIAFVFRDISDTLGMRRTDEEDALLDRFTLKGETKSLSVPTDHQKTVLIDFEDHENRHGYVMGHNSKTEYWSDRNFTHRDPRREMDYMPYHDFSIRVKGPLTIDINRNFCEAWCGSVRNLDGHLAPKRKGDPLLAPRSNAPVFGPPVSLYYENKKTMLERREALYEEIMTKAEGTAHGQIVRTRPDNNPLFGYKEKEIKEAYLQAVRFGRNYILIVNQYCQYAKLIRHIKHWRFEYMQRVKHHASQGKNVTAGTFYILMGTCKPESHAQVFRAHQMANELGLGDQFGTAEDEMYTVVDDGQGGKKIVRTEAGSDLSADPKVLTTDLEADALKIKPLFFMFYTQAPDGELAQQVYVHAKLMVQDDVFFTMGSANLNIRSMAVDSELNLISDHYPTATKLRYELFDFYHGKEYPNEEEPPEEGVEDFPNDMSIMTQEKMTTLYKKMGDLMIDNEKRVKDKLQINGHIAKFEDDRGVVGITRNG